MVPPNCKGSWEMSSSYVPGRKGRQAWPAHWSPSQGYMRSKWPSTWKGCLAPSQQPCTALLHASERITTCAGFTSLVCITLWFPWTWWYLPTPPASSKGNISLCVGSCRCPCRVSHGSPAPAMLRGPRVARPLLVTGPQRDLV